LEKGIYYPSRILKIPKPCVSIKLSPKRGGIIPGPLILYDRQ